MIKKKILIFVQNLNGGGAERVLINYLNLFDLKKFEICIAFAYMEGELLKNIPNGVSIVDFRIKKSLKCIFKLRKLIKSYNPDILYSTLARTHVVAYLSNLGLKNRVSLVFRSPNSPKQYMIDDPINYIFRYLLTKAYNKSDLIISQTEEMKTELVKYHFVREDNIKVVTNPIDKSKIISLSINSQNPFDSNNINVVAAGRLIRQKGFDTLITSFVEVVKINPLFHLHIIGKDVDNQLCNLSEMVVHLRLSSFVTFHGFQDNPYKFFKHSDLYVLSSRWEGLPNTVLENLFLNKPIVATRCISFMDELIQNGVNGWLTDVDNIKQLTEAILNYKELNPQLTNNSTSDFNINTLFEQVKHNE
jgi:glycosyltransferase involved in cell wall biosynthesis